MSPLFFPRLILVALIALALIGVGAGATHHYYAPKLKQLQSEFDVFKGGVAALGKAAEKRAKDIEAVNQKRKQDADKENADAFAVANRAIASLRRDADRARGSFVPGPVPAAKRPDLACFDRIELESAVRIIVTEVRGLVDEGTKATIDLNTARVWAATRETP